MEQAKFAERRLLVEAVTDGDGSILLFSCNEVGTPRAVRTSIGHVARLYPHLRRPPWLLLFVAPLVSQIPFHLPTSKPLTLPRFPTFATFIKTPLLTLTSLNRSQLGVPCTNPYTGRFVMLTLLLLTFLLNA